MSDHWFYIMPDEYERAAMICLKGDVVRTKSGETGEIVDTWGIARDWCKLRTSDGRTVITMTENISSIIQRNRQQRTGRKR